MREIEWPPNSGVVVRYGEAESALMREIVQSGSPTARDEALFIHDLVGELGATVYAGSASLHAAEPLGDPDVPALGRFHDPSSGEPSTSRRAAAMIAPRTGTQRRAVLDVIAGAAEHGATDDEIAAATGLDRYVAGTRRGELVGDEQFGGWVVNSGRERKSAKGNPATVWVLSERARELLAA